MTKKEVSPLAIFRDLCVKLSRVFKDVYIVRNKYCIGGKVSDEEALGEILCILEPKFSDAILNLLGGIQMLFPLKSLSLSRQNYTLFVIRDH